MTVLRVVGIVFAIALFGLGLGGSFFANFLQSRYPGLAFHLVSAGTIPLSNIAVGLKVASSVFLVFVILSVLRIVVARDGSRTMVQEEEEE